MRPLLPLYTDVRYEPTGRIVFRMERSGLGSHVRLVPQIELRRTCRRSDLDGQPPKDVEQIVLRDVTFQDIQSFKFSCEAVV